MLIWISISLSKHFDFDIWWIGCFTLEPELNLENVPQYPFYFSQHYTIIIIIIDAMSREHMFWIDMMMYIREQ